MKILERFGITVPRPRGKPRGTLRARRGSRFGPPTEIFKTHGQLGKHRFGRLCDVRGVEEFETDFFQHPFFKGGLAGLGQAGCHQTPAEMDPKFLKLLRGHLGCEGCGPPGKPDF